MKKAGAGWFIFLIFLAEIAGAQDTLRTGFEVIASVSEGQALATDPDGLIYVAFASELIQFDHTGTVQSRLEGTSTEVFGGLSDIDPGNGLIWTVADEEKGSLLRFSKELLHLETIRVPGNRDTERSRSARLDLDNGRAISSGQPVAVATGAAGELFVVDASSQSILKWDASRRLERTIGGFGTGAGQLTDPVDIATDATSLYIADRALGVIRIYDYFGGHVRDLNGGEDIKSIAVADSELWVVFSRSIWMYDDRGRIVRQIVFELDTPLVAASPSGDYAILLTGEHVLRIEI